MTRTCPKALRLLVWSEMNDPLPLSAIEHFAYCRRQAALIHLEAQWDSNAHTAQGEADHASVDRATRSETREGIMTWLSLPVWSETLGLSGICDAVELRPHAATPIEYKPKYVRLLLGPAAQQLAAQAMCLEEMLGLSVAVGYLYTRKDQRRHRVDIDPTLRAATLDTVTAVQAMLESQRLPEPEAGPKCHHCSLAEICGVWTPSRPTASLFIPAELEVW